MSCLLTLRGRCSFDVDILVVLFCLDIVDCLDKTAYDIPEPRCTFDRRQDGYCRSVALLPVNPALTSVGGGGGGGERNESKSINYK
jgi:hypothetical protein